VRVHIAILTAVLCAGACAAAGTASADPPSLFTRPGELLGHTLRFRGAVGAEQAGRTLQIQRQVAGGAWTQTATATVAPDGTFLARWRTDAIGSFVVRALIAGTEAQAADALPLTTNVTVYRPARATWFGPGFYGKRTACGKRLGRKTLGVAHRTLPCGTRVTFYHAGRFVTVAVIDRGPFQRGVAWDLTEAAAKRLGFRSTGALRSLH
jgi:peptidoglycan lytic transglycosylase